MLQCLKDRIIDDANAYTAKAVEHICRRNGEVRGHEKGIHDEVAQRALCNI